MLFSKAPDPSLITGASAMVLSNDTRTAVFGGKPEPWTVVPIPGGPDAGDTVIVCALRLRDTSAMSNKGRKGAVPFRIDNCNTMTPLPDGEGEVSDEVGSEVRSLAGWPLRARPLRVYALWQI